MKTLKIKDLTKALIIVGLMVGLPACGGGSTTGTGSDPVNNPTDDSGLGSGGSGGNGGGSQGIDPILTIPMKPIDMISCAGSPDSEAANPYGNFTANFSMPPAKAQYVKVNTLCDGVQKESAVIITNPDGSLSYTIAKPATTVACGVGSTLTIEAHYENYVSGSCNWKLSIDPTLIYNAPF